MCGPPVCTASHFQTPSSPGNAKAMQCPTCGHVPTTVVDHEVNGSGVRRQRSCPECGLRFATHEQAATVGIQVRNRDGRREEFQRHKLLESLRISARKRDLAAGAIEAIVEDVERRLSVSGHDEVPSRVISEIVIGHLRMLDPIAYIRFASAYRQFVSIDDMLDELERLEYSPVPPAEQPRLFEELPFAPTPIESAPSAASR
ncbi:MAG: transcriptional repressor NrdR [Chloroflexi bacterium]|nr:transcriptional repressor NrdR [Chloroflexota bacterium]